MSMDSDSTTVTEEIQDELQEYVEPEEIKQEETVKKEKKKRKKKKISEGDSTHSNPSDYVPR